MILTCGSWAENKRLSGGWDTEFTQLAIPYWINLVWFNLLSMYRAYTVCKMWCRTSGFGDGIPQLLSSLRFCSLRAEIIIQLTCDKKEPSKGTEGGECAGMCLLMTFRLLERLEVAITCRCQDVAFAELHRPHS